MGCARALGPERDAGRTLIWTSAEVPLVSTLKQVSNKRTLIISYIVHPEKENEGIGGNRTEGSS